MEQVNRIKNWYCDCKAGARVVGTCVHVSSVLWYLGVARHHPELVKKRPSTKFMEYLRDAGKILEEMNEFSTNEDNNDEEK